MKEERMARNKLVAQEKPPAANTLFIYHREQHNDVTSPDHTHRHLTMMIYFGSENKKK